MIHTHKSRPRTGGLFAAILAVCLVSSCDSKKPAPQTKPAPQAVSPGPAADSTKNGAPDSGKGALLKDNPANINVTFDPVAIRNALGPSNSNQKDFPVAVAIFTLTNRTLEYDEVKILIPDWDVEGVVKEPGKGFRRVKHYWYSYNAKRPGKQAVPFKVEGYRNGKGTLLYQGSINPQKK